MAAIEKLIYKLYVPNTSIAGFHFHAIKNKNRHHSMNKVKNLRYDT